MEQMKTFNKDQKWLVMWHLLLNKSNVSLLSFKVDRNFLGSF